MSGEVVSGRALSPGAPWTAPRSGINPASTRITIVFLRILFSLTFVFFARFAVITHAIAGPEADPGTQRVDRVEVVFGPKCEKMLLSEINQAEKEILVAIYSITRKSIRSALVNAVKRDVKVCVKYDVKSAEWKGMKQAIGYMKKRGVKCVPVKMKHKYAKLHHKFTVIDGKRVLTGSYNYTTSASMWNYENLVLIESADIAKAFIKEFKKIKNR